MEGAAYVLCAITAMLCSGLLLRHYGRGRVPLLLWCGLFFLALAAENVILFVDRVILPDLDLSVWRNAVALLGLSGLLIALIEDVK